MRRTDDGPYYIPHKTTEVLTWSLLDLEAADTTEQAIDLTGMTVTADVVDRLGNAVTLAGTFAVVAGSEAAGTVGYTPAGTTDFDNWATESPWGVRWKVSDGNTHFFVPNGRLRDQWRVAP